MLGVAATCAAVENAALAPLAFEPLPLGAIAPQGWLLSQLKIQADGLSGHLDEFWPDVRDSGWIGGPAEGWERAPYWLDGFVPLAFLLDDPRLEEKAHRWMNYILDHQAEDGWFGPLHGKRDGNVSGNVYDPWSQFIFLKALTQYQEATGDERAIPAMVRSVRKLEAVLKERPLFEWGQYRWMDGVASVYWLYERTGEAWLLDVADTLHAQGFDWKTHYTDMPFKTRTERDKASLASHGVNNAMGIKAPALWYRRSHGADDKAAVLTALAILDRYHGQATGMFTCDEHFAGLNPSQGSELCAVVEYMYSLEHAISVLGEVPLADRLERLAFNALPATFKKDMWAHQYDQQVNQPIACVAKDPIYTTNGPDANIFGLEPNYGCCTANMHQGWPKFASHLWMRSGKGLAAIAYAPCEVRTEIEGAPVRLTVETEYPFRDTVTIHIATDTPVTFPIELRIPAWAEGATVAVDESTAQEAVPGRFHRIEREWTDGTAILLHLPMSARVEKRYNDAIAIHRGPLVYALNVAGEWRQIKGEAPHADWEVHPTAPWNYALQLGPDLNAAIKFTERSVGAMPFSPDGAPVVARVKGRRVPEWTLVQDAAGPLPQSPVASAEPLETLELVPYGATSLRITELPILE